MLMTFTSNLPRGELAGLRVKGLVPSVRDGAATRVGSMLPRAPATTPCTVLRRHGEPAAMACHQLTRRRGQ